MKRIALKAVIALAALSALVPAVTLTFAAPQGGGAAKGTAADPKTLNGKLKPYTSPYYNVYTDLEDADVKETLIRMTKMAEEYHERTRYLFSGTISIKLPFYLYADRNDYYTAGGMAGSAGVFTGDSLMAMTIRDREGRVGLGTWHVVQHEGFHQFVHYVVRGDIPTWTNEGLAEYFGEGIFTGDGMVTGVIPNGRLKRVQDEMKTGKMKSVKEMMLIKLREWNQALGDGGAGANYDMAWAMTHFLAHADNGKYQGAFANFLVLVGKGNPWDRAWVAAFGSADGFEDKWKDYWLKQPDDPTLDLYAKAVVSTYTSFLGRAYTQKQTYDTFEEFNKVEPKDLKAAPADWLPPGLLTEMRELGKQLAERKGCTFSLVRGNRGPLPSVQCVMEDGTKVTGSFTMSGLRIGKITTEILKPGGNKTGAASPAGK